MYRALHYKIRHDKFYSDVIIDYNALDDLEINYDSNIFERMKIVHMEFDSDLNQIAYFGPTVETNDVNITDHKNSMDSKLPNVQWEISN